MAPHLVRAQIAYKDTRIRCYHHTRARAHTHTHTHTANACITGDGLVKRQISMQRRRDGFSVLPLTYEEGQRQFVNM